MNHRQQKLKRLALTVKARGLQAAAPAAASAAIHPASAAPAARPVAKPSAASTAARVTTSKDYAEAEGITVSTARSRLEKLVAQGQASRAEVVRNGSRCIEYTLQG